MARFHGALGQIGDEALEPIGHARRQRRIFGRLDEEDGDIDCFLVEPTRWSTTKHRGRHARKTACKRSKQEVNVLELIPKIQLSSPVPIHCNQGPISKSALPHSLTHSLV